MTGNDFNFLDCIISGKAEIPWPAPGKYGILYKLFTNTGYLINSSKHLQVYTLNLKTPFFYIKRG